MKQAKKTAVCGMMTALSVVLMFGTTLLPVLMYVLPIITGMLVLLIARTINKKWALGVFFATSFLSLILLTDKETALAYAIFFGYYPIIKENLEKLPKALSYFLKLLIFNAAAVASGFIGVYVFGLSSEEYSEFGKWTIPILLGLGNLVFVVYDIALKRAEILMKILSKKFKKLIK